MSIRPPNILFLFPDQQRPDWIGPTSDLPLRTPSIDRLANEGVTFATCYSNSPLCAPARACLASGRRYERCGVPNNRYNYPLDQPTYYQLLRDAGYRVAGCGKFDLHKDTLDWGLDGTRHIREWGFTDGVDNEGKFDGSRSYAQDRSPKGPYMAALAERGYADQYVEEHRANKANRGAYTTVVPDDLYCDNWLSDNGLRLLSDIPVGIPWHLVVNFTGPHNPMDVTESMRRRWEGVEFPMPHGNDQSDYSVEDHLRNRQNYAAMVENIDRQIGRFLDAVAARGELDNTVVIYSSDHGEMLGDHGSWGKSTWRWPSAHVPLIIKAPEAARGARTNALASTHDLAATILDYAGVEVPEFMDARSLKPVLDAPERTHRDVLLAGLDSPNDSWRLAFDGRYKYVRHGDDRMLFDLERDPWEDTDILATSAAAADRLAAVLDDRGA